MKSAALSRTRPQRLARGVRFGTIVVATIGVAWMLREGANEVLVVAGGLLLTTAAWIAVGSLIAGQVPRNPIGWLLSSAAAIVSVTLLAMAALVTYEPPVTATETAAAWWIVVVPFSTIPPLLILAFLFFPDGRTLGRWARVGASAAVLGGIALAIGNAARPDRVGFSDVGLIGPSWILAIPGQRGFNGAGAILLLVGLVAAAVSVGIRYRRATPEERGAIRWVIRLVIALALLPLLLLLGWPGFILAFLIGGAIVLFALPAALLVAVLRSRVFEVELQIRRTIVLGAVVLFVVGSFVVVVGFVTTMVTGAIEPIVVIPALLIGIGIGPVRRWAQRGADRLLFGERATPYEVLSDFSERVGETYSVDDVLPRMAQLLATGTGAVESRVWITTGGMLRSVAVHPADAPMADPIPVGDSALPAIPGVTAAFPVEHVGALLGALTLRMSKTDPIDASKERLARDLASQAGLVLRNVALIEDLRESRRRIVASQDARARKLERDIHDGAQQQLVALSVKLKLAEQLVERDPQRSVALLRSLHDEVAEALGDLRDLARGIYPPLLADEGLETALTAQARKATVPVTVEAAAVGRFDEEVEAAVYFSCLEALQNVGKYAHASRATVTLTNGENALAFSIEDDGVGFDPATAARGSGLQGIEDRLASLGGSLRIDTSPGAGTRLRGRIPISPDAWAPAAAAPVEESAI